MTTLTSEMLPLLSDERLLALDAFCTCDTGQIIKRMVEKRVASWSQFITDTKKHNEEARTHKLAELMAGAEIPPEYAQRTINGFRTKFDEPGKREAIEAAVEMGRNGFVLEDSEKKFGLYLWGELGTGKTSLLVPAFARQMEVLGGGLWLQYRLFMAEVRAGYATNEAYPRIKAAIETPALFLDDLGLVDKSTETAHSADVLWMILQNRYNYHRQTYITSNLDPRQIAEHFGNEGIAHRLGDLCKVVQLGGTVLRKRRW